MDSIIMHLFEHKQIEQLAEDTQIGSIVVPKGYVNATDMCKANCKKVNDWLRLKETKQYVDELSLEMGINSSNLIESIKGGKDKNKQGTWIHPRLFKNLEQWLEKASRRKTVVKFSEKAIQKKLAKRLNAQVEVNTPIGKIDLLTSKEVIEVKDIKNWKSAVGQVLMYGNYYPSHQKRIHLYGVEDCKINICVT